MRPLRSMTRVAVLPTVLVLGLLAGCGGSGARTTDGSGTAAVSGAGLVDTVRAAAEKTASESSKFTLMSQTKLGATTVAFKGEGIYDPAERVGTVAFDVPVASGNPTRGRIEERLIGDDLYLQLPQQVGVFYKTTVQQVTGTSLGATSDPTASLQALLGAVDVRRTGEGSVRGAKTTGYEGMFRVADALALANPRAKAFLQTTLKGLEDVSVPFTIQLDDQGRAVSFTQQLTSAKGLNSTTTIEFYEFGVPVTVAAPPAASVRDGAPLLAALQGLAGAAPAGSPKPVASPVASAVPSPSPAA